MIENAMLDNLNLGVILLDMEMKIKYFNRYIKKLLGDRMKESNIPQFLGNILKCKNSDQSKVCGSFQSCSTCDIRKIISKIKRGDESVIFEVDSLSDRFNLENYGRFELRIYSVKIDGEEYIQIELHDISKRKKLELFLDSMEDLIFYFDSEGKIEYCNNAYTKFLDMSYSEVIGKTEGEIFPEDMVKKCMENTKFAMENGTFFDEEELGGQWFQTFKGKVEGANSTPGILGIVRNITSQKEKELILKEKAYKDILTGIFNRNFFEEKVEKITKNRNYSLLLIDIDDFKIINDTKGHDVGDEILKLISKAIENSIRKNDYPIRMGGDEFLVIVDHQIETAKAIAERIMVQISKSFIPFSLSIGISEKKDSDADFRSVLKRADETLYKAKVRGKNQIIYKI